MFEFEFEVEHVKRFNHLSYKRWKGNEEEINEILMKYEIDEQVGSGRSLGDFFTTNPI